MAQPSPAPKSDDSFWDKGSTATAPAVALLQPDGQRSGQSPESAATGTAATASPGASVLLGTSAVGKAQLAIRAQCLLLCITL